MATEQIAVRIPDWMLERVDALVESGLFESRAAAVRAGLEVVLDDARRRAIDAAIIRGYERIPPTEEEARLAEAFFRRSIAEEEPW